MKRVARQASSEDTGGVSTSSLNIDTTDTGAPSSTPTQASAATSDTTATSATDGGSNVPSATTTVVTDTSATASGSSATTAAETTPTSTAPPTSQVTSTSGGASDTTDSETSNTGPSQTTQTSVSSDSDTTQNTSGAQSSSSALSDSISASSISSGSSTGSSATTTGSQSSVTDISSDTSVSPSSTSSFPSSTTDFTSTTHSSSTTESTTTTTQSTTHSSSTGSSRTSAIAGTASTSLTTSFTDVISTINGQATTIFSPVATLDTDTSSTLTTSHRTAIIAGGTVAGVVFILLCLAVVFLCKRQQKRTLARSHRYLPTPRSVMLAGEDDFDLAGSNDPQRGFAIFGSRRRNNDANEYRDIPSESGRHLDAPEMRELPNEPPPRLLRPVASKTGSYFQESVWPPPDEGSRLSDPLMAASNVDLHSIVDEVMGSRTHLPRPSVEASSTSSLPRPSRLRGGAAEDASPFSEVGTPTEIVPRIAGHGESPTMSSIGSCLPDSPRHMRDCSTGSEAGLIANMEGSGRGARRSSGGSGAGHGPWLPPGAAPPSAYGRITSPTSPLRLVTEPQQIHSPSPPSARARAKAGEAAQERRSSLTVSNPNPEEYETDDVARAGAGRTLQEDATSSVLAPSFSVSTTSTQRLRRLAGGMESGAQTPYPDESPIDARSLPPSLAHAWLLDVDEEEPPPPNTGVGPKPRDEIPPRYDMIRRDTSTSEVGGAGAGTGAGGGTDSTPNRSSNARAL